MGVCGEGGGVGGVECSVTRAFFYCLCIEYFNTLFVTYSDIHLCAPRTDISVARW